MKRMNETSKRNGSKKRGMTKIALFNHKGGVGKTTLTINIAAALADAGKTVLLLDADPQCNLTSFYLTEDLLEELLGDSDGDGGQTVWSAVRPVVKGRGGVVDIELVNVYDEGKIFLLPGDVLLSEYEEVLPQAWTECFARNTRGYDVVSALSQVANRAGAEAGATVCLYDMGPNVGALNRAALLDCDYFITPVAADLFSLRALSTVGLSVAKWITDWKTIRGLATPANRATLLKGRPAYLGYIASAFKVSTGRTAADPHADWESKIAPRVRNRIVEDIAAVDPNLVPQGGSYKLGGIKHFHSLAPAAQAVGIAIGDLRGHVNTGQYHQVDEAKDEFAALTKEIIRRADL
jgi:cellulose biosynthesis protein BcsQ